MNRLVIHCQKKWFLIFQRVGFSLNGFVIIEGSIRRPFLHTIMSTPMEELFLSAYIQTNILLILNSTLMKYGFLNMPLNTSLNETKGH
ncbi:hypothetical protein AFK63_10680 [Cronobacter muytjensii ATCC 51329]|nr:hypothetical protein AFK63_10680 [Cronobacter muytjensii ATCC 51329]